MIDTRRRTFPFFLSLAFRQFDRPVLAILSSNLLEVYVKATVSRERDKNNPKIAINKFDNS